VEDLPARRKKKQFRRFNAHVCQIRRFHSREDVEWEAEEDSDTEEEKKNSESEEENGVVNNTEEPEENLPSVAVSETVGEENEPEAKPREAEKTRSGRQTRPPRWHNDYARH
jgi:hypothetical protein